MNIEPNNKLLVIGDSESTLFDAHLTRFTAKSMIPISDRCSRSVLG
jgi:hypothetical protein